MAQHYISTFDLVSGTETFGDVMGEINSFTEAVKSGQLGETRPAGIARGGLWSDNIGSGDGDRVNVYVFDGTDDKLLAQIEDVVNRNGDDIKDFLTIRADAGDDALLSLQHSGFTDSVATVQFSDSLDPRWGIVLEGTSATAALEIRHYDATAAVDATVTIEADGTLDTPTGVKVAGTQVVGAQQVAIADSAGGDEQAKINAILAALRAHGLIGT